MTTPADRSRIDTAPATEKYRVAKVDTDLGIVIGFGCISKEAGQPYFDLHNQHLPEDEMVKATVKFLERPKRSAKIMHAGEDVGVVLGAVPMDEATFKACYDGMEPPRTGALIIWKPTDKALLQKFASGEWTGFSFGGWASTENVP